MALDMEAIKARRDVGRPWFPTGIEEVIAYVGECEKDRTALIARVEELEALRSKRLPFREAEIAQARYEKAGAERDALKQELDLSVKLREAADARIKELEAAIQAKCAYCRKVWDVDDGGDHCPPECPLLPYRGGE